MQSAVRLPDTNGDGFVTPADPLRVINELNGAGEGEVVGYRLEVTDAAGNPVSSATVGDTLFLRGYVQDLRDATEAEGVFSGYLDVEYDAGARECAGGPMRSHSGTTFPTGNLELRPPRG